MSSSLRSAIVVMSTILALAAAAGPALAGGPQPQKAGYGYLVQRDDACAVWWAEGAYKVMKGDAVPAAAGGTVRISAARNEFEPFLVVLRPEVRLDDVRVAPGPLRGEEGGVIAAADIAVRHVEYVKITTPTDEAGGMGWWPDPLPPYDGPFTAFPGENHPLWITVRVPKDASAGLYRGSVLFTAGGWSLSVPVELTVRGFTLPERSSVRSSFGIGTWDIKTYHNLETDEELATVVDLYYENMRQHRVAPTSPFDLAPMKVTTSGVFWKGGEFVGEGVHGGRRAYKVTDADPTKNIAAEYEAPILIDAIAGGGSGQAIPVKDLKLALDFWARTASDGQKYTIVCEFYDPEGKWLAGANVLKVFTGAKDWKTEHVDIGGLPEEAASLRLLLFPAFRDVEGASTGTAWFDDVSLTAASGASGARAGNLVSGGDFEMPASGMKVGVDFTDFDRAAHRYLDEFGFNAYDLALQGLGTGSFYSQTKGSFAGFAQGTPEYDALLSQYLRLVEDHLAAKGWLGREYIYWFDEPDPENYPFVREGMQNIRKNAPRLTRFITEHRPGPGIMDVSEIGCTIFDRVDPKTVAELAPKGREFWSYLCTGPKSPWVTLFIDHPAVNLRMWLWMSYAWKLGGILVWRANYWTSSTLFPQGVFQNPWQDPMSYTVGYGVPMGDVRHWGNGDGRFLYPPNRDPVRDRTKYLTGPVDSFRWEMIREGIEDYEYFVLLDKAVKDARGSGATGAKSGRSEKNLIDEAGRLLAIPPEIFTNGKDYTKDPLDLLRYRSRVADMIEKLGKR